MSPHALATPLDIPFPYASVEAFIRAAEIDFSALNVEELWQLINTIEERLRVRFVRMDFGIPGLPPPTRAVQAQIHALRETSIAAQYPPHAGLPALREQCALFIGRTLNVGLSAEHCFVTCGATQGLFVALSLAAYRREDRDTVLFLEPGYPPVKAQARFLGMHPLGIDLQIGRGKTLLRRVADALETHRVAAICWSSPNNPTWMRLDTEELQGLAQLCRTHDVVAIEDLAYLGMHAPPLHCGAPAQESISRFADKWFVTISASKMLSYAGERIGMLATSPALLVERHPALAQRLGNAEVRRALPALIFNLTAGAPHSAQYAIAALLASIAEGRHHLAESLRPYRVRAKAAQRLMTQHGFGVACGDAADGANNTTTPEAGFYFTFWREGFDGNELLHTLLCHGIAALPLHVFGSSQTQALRACVAQLDPPALVRLQERLAYFNHHNPHTSDMKVFP